MNKATKTEQRTLSLQGVTLASAHEHTWGGQVMHHLASLWGSVDDISRRSGLRFRVSIELRDTKQATGGNATIETWRDARGWVEVASVQPNEVRNPTHVSKGGNFEVDVKLLRQVEEKLIRRAMWILGATDAIAEGE